MEPERRSHQTLAVSEDVADFDDLFSHIGDFGLYQKLLFVMTIFSNISVAFLYFGQIFIGLVPENHWCMILALQYLPIDQRKDLGIPRKNSRYSQCSMYVVNWTNVLTQGLTPNDTWETTKCLHGWDFDSVEQPYTTISMEMEWVCENSYLVRAAESIFFIGAILGGLIWGWVAGKWGRIPALMGANLVGFLGGILTAFSTSFRTFALYRFIAGSAYDNGFTMNILVLEYVGPRWRTFFAYISKALFFTLAACAIPWVSLWVANWRWIAIVTSLPLLAFVVIPFLVPESARWLVSHGKSQKGIQIMEKINKKELDPHIYDTLRLACERSERSSSLLDLFKTPRLRRITILFIVIWMSISLVFDGHVRSVHSLGMNPFITFTIAAATELPADILLTLTLDRWGRRWLACLSLMLAGIFSLMSTVMTKKLDAGIMAICGRFAVNISYNIGLQNAAEVLPAVVRAQGVALIHTMGYIANILSPFVVHLGTYDENLPFLILGMVSIIGGLLFLFVPETMDRDLPQSLQDGEDFGKDDSLCDMPCFKRKEDKLGKGETLKSECSTRDSFRRTAPAIQMYERGGASFRSQMVKATLHKEESESKETSHHLLVPVPEEANLQWMQSKKFSSFFHSSVNLGSAESTPSSSGTKKQRESISVDKLEKAGGKLIDEVLHSKSVVHKIESWSSFMPKDSEHKDNKKDQMTQHSGKLQSWGDYMQALGMKAEKKEFRNLTALQYAEKASAAEGSAKNVDNLSVKIKYIQSQSWSELGEDLLEAVMTRRWPSTSSDV